MRSKATRHANNTGFVRAGGRHVSEREFIPVHHNPVCLSLLCALILWQTADANAERRPTRPKQILSAIATADNNATLIDITLNGTVKPTLKADGVNLTLTLPDAAPDPQLAAHLATGGGVARLDLELPTKEKPFSIFHVTLQLPMKAEFVPGPTPQTVRVRLTTEGGAAKTEAVRPAGTGLYDVDAVQSNIADLLKALAQDEGASVVLASAINAKVTVSLRQKTFVQSLDLLTKSAGLTYHQDGTTFVVGMPKDIETAFPKPQAEVVKPLAPTMRQEVYHCRHISAKDVVATLNNMFDRADLRVATGASSITPHLDEVKSGAVTGTDGAVLKGGAGGSGGGGEDTALASKDVILYGEESVVARALDLAKKLDVRRKQVRIEVKIVDISFDELNDLGVKWTLPQYNVSETAANGINFGTFTHLPINIGTDLTAKENTGHSKLLAQPNLTMLDGERSFILIGQRLTYPKLTGYTQAQTPIFDKEEQRVGIYVQFAAQISEDGEITLSVYPQVSTVTGYLTINGASYPQISTREQQTTVRFKNGEQLIIGGLIRNDEIKNIERVPGLSKIPILGELFTYRKTTHAKSDVVIMLCPKLMED